jgi:filamentous hemagglutinin
MTVAAQANVSLRNGNMAAPHGSGASSSAVSSQTTTAASVAAGQAAVVAGNAQAATTRSLQALAALQAAQGAARQTALAGGVNNLGFNPNQPGQTLPNVPDGIAPGGLMPAGGPPQVAGSTASTTSYVVPTSWSGVSGLTQSTSGNSVTDTVTQAPSSQQALLYWTTFNIGRNTTLSFDQSAGGANVNQWVAINQIQDPSLAPSQILGAIHAQGQVYVINQNGIIFGGSSQVNVHGLVASSLALNPAYITNGLLNNAQNNDQFQFSNLVAATTQLNSVSEEVTTVAPLWSAPTTPTGGSQEVFAVPAGDVTVQAGAQLSSPTDANHDGGRIALIAPNVVNNGTISTPDGQTIIAAGEQVGFAAHASTDPTLRGLDISIGQVAAGSATLADETFTFNGLPGGSPLADDGNLPGNENLTLTGSGPLGSYTTPDGLTTVPLTAGTTSIPLGSSVTLDGGATTFAAAQAGSATNEGDVEAPRADVTLAGKSVNQLGVINSSTSVTLNGRIDLLANYDAQASTVNNVTSLYPLATGSVTFGSGSVTQILPEVSDSDTVVGSQLALSSIVNVEALNITMQPNSVLQVPSANLPSDTSTPALDAVGAGLKAGVSFDAGTWYPVSATPGLEQTVFSNSTGTIQLDSGAILDVSGSQNVSDSVAQNIVSAQLRGPELADSTLQQNGPLRGDSVLVNLQETGIYDGVPWIGTPLGDVAGYVDDIEHTVGQLTTNGGTVALNAGASVNLATGSTINVSGGYINYAGAMVQTSKVITESGSLIDISQAVPSVVYEGIYNGYTESSPKYGIFQTFLSSLLTGAHFETGYLQGGNGGSLNISAPSITLNGNFEGNTVTGPNQQTPVAQLQNSYGVAPFLPVTEQVDGIPVPSALDISYFQLSENGGGTVYPSTAPNVDFVTDSTLAQTTSSSTELLLSEDIINDDGFGRLNLNTAAGGTITVAPGVDLIAPYGGALDFLAANIEIDGSISTPGQGSITLEAEDISPRLTGGNLTYNAQRGQIVVAPGVSLTANGLIVDDEEGAGGLPLALNGGTITIEALDIDLAPGSAIDVSGGAAVSATKSVQYGNAGSISILGARDPVASTLVTGGSLQIGSTLSGYSGEVGGAGTLTIQGGQVQVGGTALVNGDDSAAAFISNNSGLMTNGSTLWLDPVGQADFFSTGGFGNFDIEGIGTLATNGSGAYLFDAVGDPVVNPAVLIVSGTTIRPVVQVSRATLDQDGVTLAPLSVQQAASLLPSQRSSSNLVFNAEGLVGSTGGPPLPGGGTFINQQDGGGLLVRGDLVMQEGTTIETDPETNSSKGVQLLAGNGTAAVLGSIISPGGTLVIEGGSTSSISANQLLFYETSEDQPFPTVDLGPNSVLSAAGIAEQTFNGLGYDTGSVLGGGNITLEGNIVAEEGSTLDVAGSEANFDELAISRDVSSRSVLSPLYVPVTVDSNGGTIALKATQLLFSDATLLGNAGGPAAQGGTLSVSSLFADTVIPNAAPSPVDIALVVTQLGRYGGFSLPAGFGSGLQVVRNGDPISPISTATGNVDSVFVANPNLFVNTPVGTTLSDNGGLAGGFSSLSLAGTVDFQGPVSISVDQSLSLGLSSGTVTSGQTGGVIYTDSPVVLSAPYIALNLDLGQPDVVVADAYPTPTSGPGTLTIDASVLADVGNISTQNIGTLSFNASGTAGAIRGDGTLQSAGTIDLNATQIYPPTADTFTIDAVTVNIAAPADQPLPALPISGGGTLNLEANTIDQSGVLRAPLGTINLGTSSTHNVILAPGSITSVSAVDPLTGVGIVIPYGLIDSSGDWYDPNGNDITVAGNGTGGVPAKAINLSGQNIDAQAGSTIDVTGGGELFAYGFVPGTGGNVDILASTTSFAIIPGYSAAYAPVGAYASSNNLETNGVADLGYDNSSLAVGEQIHLDGSTGLPAGSYTLLPARYALLPGAFLVTPSSNRPTATSIREPDGSSIVAGYVTNGLSPAAPGLYASFQVDPQSVVLAEAPYTESYANSFFAASASANGIPTPRLPQDAGQVVLNASASMTLAGALLSAPAAGGLGGEVDIASTEPIYIVGPSEASSVPAGALALDASQLTDFGASSLLIGGYRTNSDTGTAVTVTTNNLVVNDAGASSAIDGEAVDGLAAPDLTLVSNDTLTLAPNAVIEEVGPPTSGAETLDLGGVSGGAPAGSGDGVLLRVSSDPNAQIVRENVNPAVTTPQLTLSAEASIINAEGGPVGALTLDSTAGLSVNTTANLAPTLSGNTLTLDSGSINLELSTPITAPTSGLVITNTELQSLLASTQALSFLSYSSIALYGSGEIGTATTNASGQTVYQEGSLALHADDIYYGDSQNSAGVIINARNVTLDNLAGGTTLPSLANRGTSNLTINAQTLALGSGAVRLDQFASTTFKADEAILIRGLGTEVANSDNVPTPASLTTGGSLTLSTPIITDAAPDRAATASTTTAVDQSVAATGALTIQAPVLPTDLAISPGGLDAQLDLSGTSLNQAGGSIVLPSGSISLEASTGGMTVDGALNVAGLEQTFYGLNKFTNGGQVSLSAPSGPVTLGSASAINVSAASGFGTVDSVPGNAGSLTISSPTGLFTVESVPGALDGDAGQVLASGGTVLAQGTAGAFSLDAAQLTGTQLSALESEITTTTLVGGDLYVSGFVGSQSVRLRDQSITIDQVVATQNFSLSADDGSITIAPTGSVIATAPQAGGIDTATTIQAGATVLANPGGTGGTISLAAFGSVNLRGESFLGASGQAVDDAGEGGTISLAAGSDTVIGGADTIDPTGSINIDSGASIDLRVLQTGTTLDGSAITGTSGVLNLRAPQILSGGNATGIQVNPVEGMIVDASTITVEGYRVYQPAGGSIDSVEAQIDADGNNFSTVMGTSSPGPSPLFAGAVLTGPTPAVNIEPGAEIINPSGDLTLASTWDLSQNRFGVNNLNQALPGVLTLRASGNIDIAFGASLNDGFTDPTYEALLLNPGSLSYSYKIVSGADLTAANILNVQSTAALGHTGSLLVGVQTGVPQVLSKTNAAADDLDTFFQTIRTGTGNISIAAGGNVELLNNVATIYTAGDQVDPTLGGTFVPPSGADQFDNPLPATYSQGGGNVLILAQGNIEHLGYGSNTSTFVADSSAEMPTNWLDREGEVSGGQTVVSTSWWVDFTNYFEGIGALGGGNVSLLAGGSVINVDADIPTNAREVNGQFTELGGGDLVVQAGNNIDGGVYYVERGSGTLSAGENIQTNATRAAVSVTASAVPLDWLPTTLFLGKGGFSTAAGGNLLMGPVANPFLLPQSSNNVVDQEDPDVEISYFSTYAAADTVNASSLSGTVTIQDSAQTGQGSLANYYDNVLDAPTAREISDAEVWLQLAAGVENPNAVINVLRGNSGSLNGVPSNVYGGLGAVLPPTLRVTSFEGSIDLVGSLTLFPSPVGTLDLAADGSINGFQPNADAAVGLNAGFVYSEGVIDVSDANPANLPNPLNPISNETVGVTLAPFFQETGATSGLTLQDESILHADIEGAPLHAGDADPIYLLADHGSISGLTTFTPKVTDIVAGTDISDIGFYLQNDNVNDVSVVEAGTDILAYDKNSALRVSAGTRVQGYKAGTTPEGIGPGAPNSGDIQISGPGTLEVIAGRNITLGNDDGQNPNNIGNVGDGVFTGLTSVGGQENPALPFAGADLVTLAGAGNAIGSGTGLSGTGLDFSSFISTFLDPGSASSSTYLPDLATALGLGGESDAQVWETYQALPQSQQDAAALQVFYLVLRDAGRNHNIPGNAGFGNYDTGYDAISALFPSNEVYGGTINLTSREVATANGGNVEMLIPGGALTVGIEVTGAPPLAQGVLTVDGGNISIFADGDVNVGSSRIFTLHGGNEIIWSTDGNIDAGASSKTVLSAPPTRVVVDSTSGDVETDLGGLATGGGIGVLASEAGVAPGDVDLIAPNGVVDAGDAGIRATGNLNIAAVQVLNASNISVGGKSSGVPTVTSVNLGAITAGSSAAGSSQQAASTTATGRPQNSAQTAQDLPSLITVEVVGYGGDDGD